MNVINDDVESESQKAHGKRQLERAAAIGAAVDVKVETVARFDLNVTQVYCTHYKNIMHQRLSLLHRKTNLMDLFWNYDENY